MLGLGRGRERGGEGKGKGWWGSELGGMKGGKGKNERAIRGGEAAAAGEHGRNIVL